MTRDELIAQNEQLRAENATLKQRIALLEVQVAELEALVAQLKGQLEEAERAAKRQAAPFSKGPPKANPKRPGRKKGHAPAHRPKPDHVDRVVEVPLPSERCPECGGPLTDHKVQEQFQVDIPPVRPIVTQFNVHVARCSRCNRRVQGRHPEQASDALGAAMVQIGPRALGLAADLKHGLGIPYRKVKALYGTAFGLEVSPGGLARAGQRLAKRAEPTYQQLILTLRHSQAVNADETGWKISGQRAWLWVFTSAAVTVYVIHPTRAHEVAERVLGEEFEGVLGCDCFLAYDPLKYRQQKCLGHLLKRCGKLRTSLSGEAVIFSQRVASLLRGAIRLKARREAMSEARYQRACERLETALDRLLAKDESDPENAKFVKLLRKHRSRLLVFLYHPEVTPTNNAAEREIRPAVVVRKISAGNRSQPGSDTHAILTSVIRTCQQQGQDFLDVSKQLLCRPARVALKLAGERGGAITRSLGHGGVQIRGP